MSELLESVRKAYFEGEVSVNLGDRVPLSVSSPQNAFEYEADKVGVRRGESIAIALLDLYPEKVTQLGEQERELAEASFVFSCGRFRLATKRLQASREGSQDDFRPTEEDYAAIAGEVGGIIAAGFSEALVYSSRRLHTLVPLIAGRHYVDKYFQANDIADARFDERSVEMAAVKDILAFTKQARAMPDHLVQRHGLVDLEE